MSYCIVCDSCTDITPEDKKRGCFSMVPLTIHVDERDFIDDETFDQQDFLAAVRNSTGALKSSCPAPEAYMEAYKKADEIYVVTLSANLSGSYNSAMVAKNLYREEYGDKKIHVVDSCSASSGQYLIALRLEELCNQGLSFEEVVKEADAYRDSLNTYFTLETLDVLKRNGRLSKVQAILASALNIKPVMGATKEGEIIKKAQARGMSKGLLKMAQIVGEEGEHFEEKTAVVAHCNCLKRAEDFKKMLLKEAPFQEVKIIDTCGISSLYACDGGIILSF
ncbi:MAG: DegV family protein [Lachnospiraceae bacterium]|nr:DegV family protein [Lachnospiraceae bacterium]